MLPVPTLQLEAVGFYLNYWVKLTGPEPPTSRGRRLTDDNEGPVSGPSKKAVDSCQDSDAYALVKLV